jgi:hypothetical protein
MIQAFPKNRWLLLAGVWFAFVTSLILRDISGLSYSKTVRFALREPAAILISVGAILLVSLFLSWVEGVLLNSKSTNALWAGRFGALVLAGVCIAATLIWCSLPAEWFPGSATP